MELGRMQTPGKAMNNEYKLAKPLASSWWLCVTAARRLFSTAISSKVVRKPCRDLEFGWLLGVSAPYVDHKK
jgi:hypothetical protein